MNSSQSPVNTNSVIKAITKELETIETNDIHTLEKNLSNLISLPKIIAQAEYNHQIDLLITVLLKRKL